LIFPFSKNDVGTYDIQIILSNGEEERKYPVTIIIEFPDDEGEETVDPDEPDEEDEEEEIIDEDSLEVSIGIITRNG